MSPKNHLLTRAQISVWYIPSIPGADAGMYFITLLYLINWSLLYIHVFVTLWHPIWGSGDHCGLWRLLNFESEIILNFEIHLNFKLNIEILLWQGGIRADEPWVINQPFTYIPTHLISAWCCSTRQHLCFGDPCVYTTMKLSPAGLGIEVVKREALHWE